MSGAEIPRPPAHYITYAQLVTLGVATGVLRYHAEPALAHSCALGGLVAILPQAYFAGMVFRYRGARAARRIAGFSQLGEVGKLVLTALGFALIFALLRPVSAGAVFAGYGCMLIIQLVGSWFLVRGPLPLDKTRVR